MRRDASFQSTCSSNFLIVAGRLWIRIRDTEIVYGAHPFREG
ncbi:hypothetical protein RBSWK_02718 [Rhodopirellula baltica SWK14]|uniref:Uncharacterized protein n=1 Tax=Rhodopirellula baltica SWK14 TaxID=993516 RepID=L7CGE4_RHOBT|nr:hypothetical protein RBSWK_02718 [Rhodopirellula baltica SWK14]